MKRLHELTPEIFGDEFVRAHLYVDEKSREKTELLEEVYVFIHNLIHNLNMEFWTFTHLVDDSHDSAMDYLKKWNVNKKLFDLVDNLAFDHLNQD